VPTRVASARVGAVGGADELMWRFESKAVVGRDVPLATLAAGLDGARVGHGGLLFLAGEPGSGKSRLVRELADRARAGGVEVLVGRAVESAVPVAYRPFAEVVLAATRGRDLLDAPDLAPLRPVLAPLLPDRPGPRRAAELSPLLVGEAVLRLARRLGPVLLVLEDLHWADTETVAAVEFIADHLAGEPVLCVATVRGPGPNPVLSLARGLARRRVAEMIELARLSEAEVTELAAACLGGADVPPPVSARLHAAADGLPLMVEELLDGLGRAGLLTRVGEGWQAPADVPRLVPETLADAVRLRLGALGAPARHVLRAAAVLGHHFDWRLLPAITGSSAAAVADIMRAGIDANLVQAVGDEFGFRHALTRDAVLLDVLAPDRIALATAALQAVDGSGTACRAASIAELAEAAGDPRRAARAWLDAGREARDLGALDIAEGILARAMSLTGSGAEQVAEAGELLVEVLALAGRSDRIGRAGEDALRALRAVGAAPERVGAVQLSMARAADRPQQARELLDAAEQLAARTGALGLLARANALGAHFDLEQGRLDDARCRAERALRDAEDAGLPEVVCEALEMLGRHARAHDPRSAAEAFRRAAEVADEHGLGLWRVRALTELGIVGFLRGEPPDRLLEARRLAGELGAISTAVTIDLHISAAFVQRFEPEAALDAARRCREAAERYRRSALLPRALTLEATALAQLGRAGEMAARLDEVRRLVPDDLELVALGWGMAHACGHLLAHQVAALRDDLDRAVALLRRAGNPGGYRYWGLWALLVTIDGPGAEQAIAEARASGAAIFDLAAAHLHYADAVSAGRAGELGRAEELFAAAAASTGDLDLLRHHAHLLVAPAALRDGWGEPVRWLLAALAYFDEHGHRSLAQACKSLLRASGAALPRAGRGQSRVSGELRALGVTSREMDVLGLVGDGRSNREIAARLHLSVRTVEGHVGTLKVKLGAASRAELVARAGRVGC
jgi:DNA-binding CsgD family transcriptional regulator